MKRARLFKNGQSQAVRLPREFRFEGEEVLVKRLGNGVLLLPVKGYWDGMLASIDEFPDDFMAEGREQPQQQQQRESL
ncbi:MAG TPA: type II toxin-antitoxin system VapB family antitoxin [Candidatus Obscuribacterales bacterium]